MSLLKELAENLIKSKSENIDIDYDLSDAKLKDKEYNVASIYLERAKLRSLEIIGLRLMQIIDMLDERK